MEASGASQEVLGGSKRLSGCVLEALDGPQESLRRFQEAFRRLEEDPRSPPGGFQEALGGSNRRLPGGSQNALTH